MTKGQNEKTNANLAHFAELIWCLEGLGEIYLYDRKFEMKAGQVFLYYPGEDHFRVAVSPQWKLRWLCFDGPLTAAILHSFEYPRLQTAAAPYPAELFARIEHAVSCVDAVETRRGAALIMEVLAHAGSDRLPDDELEPLAVRAVKLIRREYPSPAFNVDSLCETLNVPRSTLTRLFRRHYSNSPGRYLLNVRLEEAQALLKSSDLPVKEIAHRCGFNSARTFSRFIQRSLADSPGRIRKNRPGS